MAELQSAKDEGLPLTVETCPHYLHFCVEDVAGLSPLFKCAPPLRTADERERLWAALSEGLIDTIGSDHSPCPPEMKAGDFLAAWGGISSLQLTLSTVWTGAGRRGISLVRVAELLAAAPARLTGLAGRKGRIAAGCDADLCVWDPEEEWTVAGAELQHRHKLTPYEGERLRGRVKRTYVRGQLVYDEGTFVGAPRGELLRR
jgi:allantoinase